MSYSQAHFTDDPTSFPAPPMWLVWAPASGCTGTGQIRHMPTLQKAKSYVRPYRTQSTFGRDWSIYHWIDGEYVLQYSGKKNDVAADNALFQKSVRKTAKPSNTTKLDDELQAAIASITNGGPA